MKKNALSFFIALLGIIVSSIYAQRYSFMQANNINTIFRNDGIYNFDFTSIGAGFVWPVTSATRKTAVFATGLWVAAKINGQIRLAAALYRSHFTGGNIPVIGQVPPSSVCNDTANFKAYLVSLTDQTLVNGGTRNVIAVG